MGDEVSVGELIVRIRGDNSELMHALDESQKRLTNFNNSPAQSGPSVGGGRTRGGGPTYAQSDMHRELANARSLGILEEQQRVYEQAYAEHQEHIAKLDGQARIRKELDAAKTKGMLKEQQRVYDEAMKAKEQADIQNERRRERMALRDQLLMQKEIRETPLTESELRAEQNNRLGVGKPEEKSGGHGMNLGAFRLPLRVLDRQIGLPIESSLMSLGSGGLKSMGGFLAGFGGIAAAAVAGFVAIGAAISSHIKQEIELNRLRREYNHELDLTAMKWATAAQARVTNTKVGHDFEEKAAQAAEAAADARFKRDELRHQSVTGFHPMYWLEKAVYGGAKHTALGHQLNLENQKVQEQNDRAARLADVARQQQGVQIERDAAGRASELAHARTQSMHPGIDRDLQEAALDAADSRREAEQQADDRILAYHTEMNEKIAALDNNPNVSYDKVVAARKEQDDHEAAMEKEKAAAIAQTDQVLAARQAAIRAAAAQQLEREQEQATAAQTGILLTGYNRQLQALRDKGNQEVAEYKREGRDASAIIRLNAAQQQQFVADHFRELANTSRDLDIDTGVANRTINEADAAWEKYARNATENLGIVGHELEVLKEKWYALNKAQTERSFNDQIATSLVDLKLARREITDVVAAYEKLKIANPNVSPQLLMDVARVQEMTRTANFAHEQRLNDPVNGPILQMKDYIRDISAAIRSGQMSKEEGEKFIKQHAYDVGLTKPMDVGTFNAGGPGGGWRASQVDVHAINMNQPLNSIEIVTKKNGDTLVKIETNTRKDPTMIPLQ